MKNETILKNKHPLLALKPILAFKLEIRVPNNGFKLGSVNPLFRLAHFSRFDRPASIRPA